LLFLSVFLPFIHSFVRVCALHTGMLERRGNGCVRPDVKMLLIETVRQQLEGLKQESSNTPGGGHNAAVVRAFFSRQLVELTKHGFLHYMDTAEVEDVARAYARVECPEGRSDGRRDMDGRIVDCGLVLSQQLGRGRSLLLVTDDNELVARARAHGLAADSLRSITRALEGGKYGEAPWGADAMVRACSTDCQALLQRSQQAGQTVLGPFEELQLARTLGERAARLLRALESEPTVNRSRERLELAEELELACPRWANLAESRNGFQRQGVSSLGTSAPQRQSN